MLQYLQQAKLAFTFGSTLFIYGAVTDENKGTVPGSEKVFEKVHDWVDELNKWVQNEIKDYKIECKRERKRGGLIDYVVPGGNAGKSVYDSFLDNEGNPKYVSREVQEFLLSNRI